MSRSPVPHLLTFRAKWPKFKPFSAGARFAIPLLVLVCALPPTGCMVPQTIDPITAEPHPPPQFLVAQMPVAITGVPQLQFFPYEQGGACHCVLELTHLNVYEADPTIDLVVRWFLDYNVSVTRSTALVQQEYTVRGTFDNATATSRGLTDFVFDATQLQITSSGTHVLEVVVGELNGFDDSPNVALPNRTMLPGFVPAVYRFFINVTVEPVAGSCLQNSPASARSCP